MHAGCHATSGLPDGYSDADDLPPALQGIAPTCSVFCQLCALRQIIGVGGKTQKVKQLERQWKEKLETLQQEVLAYEVSHLEHPQSRKEMYCSMQCHVFHVLDMGGVEQ
jgi:hypothetical protein